MTVQSCCQVIATDLFASNTREQESSTRHNTQASKLQMVIPSTQMPEPAPQYSGFQKDPLGDLIHPKAMQMLTSVAGRSS